MLSINVIDFSSTDVNAIDFNVKFTNAIDINFIDLWHRCNSYRY